MSRTDLNGGDQAQKDDLLMRMRCTAGHLQAVTNMIEAGLPCEQTLHQLHAVQAALRKIQARMIQQEARASIETMRQHPCPEEAARRIQRLVKLYQQYL